MTQRIAAGLALGLMALPFQAHAVSLPSDPTKQNCEWVAICPPSIAAQLTPLKEFRASRGHSACIWTLDDIDDTYGGHGRNQIRQALAWAHAAWATKPRWVLLVGEHFAGGGSDDVISDWNEPNEELGYWEPNIRGLWPYMDLNDDGTPEMAVGRVPARSGASDLDAARYVAKAIRHDQDIIVHSGYNSSALLVQDVDLEGKSGDFARMLADSIYDTYDPMPNRRRVYASSIGPYPFDLAAAANAEWDLSPDHVVAMGTTSIWFQLVGFWNLAHAFAPARWNPNHLAPTYRFPVLVGLSCGINGTDQPVTNAYDPARSITEQLLFYWGDWCGASAVIAPSRSTIQHWNALIGKHLLMQRGSAVETWGEVFSHAMENALDEDPDARDHVYQYVFEGDPAVLTGALTGGGGGCPLVEVKGSDGWREENTVLARSPDGSFGEDLYRLKGLPTGAVGPLELRIRENGQEFTRLDQAQVVAVDHDPGMGAFAVGRNVLLGTRLPAARVTTSTGEDVTDRVSGWGGYFFGGPGDTLVVEFTLQEAGLARAEGTTDGSGDPGTLEGDPKEMEMPQRASAGPPVGSQYLSPLVSQRLSPLPPR